MVTNVRRPVGVLFVGILLIVSGAIGAIAGLFALLGAFAGVSTMDTMHVGLGISGGLMVVLGVLNIVFAIGILRGSRVARVIVTVLQVISIITGIVGLFSTGDFTWQLFNGVVFPAVITLLLWMGADTKAFFSRR